MNTLVDPRLWTQHSLTNPCTARDHDEYECSTNTGQLIGDKGIEDAPAA